MLGSNRFSPLSNLDSDSNVDEVLMLNWENSSLTGKGNETSNFLDCVPLVLWYSKCGLDLVTVEGEIEGIPSDDVLEPSEWVRAMIKGFGTFVGFPIACCESQCIAFIQKFGKNNLLLPSPAGQVTQVKKGTLGELPEVV